MKNESKQASLESFFNFKELRTEASFSLTAVNTNPVQLVQTFNGDDKLLWKLAGLYLENV